VLLLRRYNTGYEDGNYSVVAGHLDGGEEVKMAMIREAKEEIGIDLDYEDVTINQVMHRLADDERIDFFLSATKWTGEIENKEPHKCDELSWHSLDALPENVIPYIRHALMNHQVGCQFDSFGFGAI